MTGPHFDQGPPLEDERGRKYWDPKPCICGLTTYVDAATGLCRECWRVWRYADADVGRVDMVWVSPDLAERAKQVCGSIPCTVDDRLPPNTWRIVVVPRGVP